MKKRIINISKLHLHVAHLFLQNKQQAKIKELHFLTLFIKKRQLKLTTWMCGLALSISYIQILFNIKF